MNKVEFRNVTLSYGKNTVVKGFNLTVKDQEIIGIVGPSGCGKTTIIRALSGLKNPDVGEIYVDGKPYYSKEKRANVPPEKRNIGVVFQAFAVWPHMNIYKNVAFPLEVRRRPKAEIRGGMVYVKGGNSPAEAAPTVERCLICQRDGVFAGTLVETAKRLGCTRIQTIGEYLTENQIRKAKENGIRCNLFSAEDPTQARAWIDKGVDCVMTDNFLAVSTGLDTY